MQHCSDSIGSEQNLKGKHFVECFGKLFWGTEPRNLSLVELFLALPFRSLTSGPDMKCNSVIEAPRSRILSRGRLPTFPLNRFAN